MSETRFDPWQAVAFDLAHGLVQVDGARGHAIVPAAALAALAAAATPDARGAFGRALGEAMGERAAKRLGGQDEVREASAEAVLEHLGGEKTRRVVSGPAPELILRASSFRG